MCKDPSINYDTTRWQVCAGNVTTWTHTSSFGCDKQKYLVCWFISAWTLHTTFLRHLRHSRFLSFSTSGLRRRRYDKTPTTFNSYSSLHWISQMSERFPLTAAGVMSFTTTAHPRARINLLGKNVMFGDSVCSVYNKLTFISKEM